MSRLLYRLGRGAALHPWRTLGLWVLAAVLVFGLASVAGGAPHDNWDVPNAKAQAGIELLRQHVPGAGNASANVVAHDDQALRPATLAALGDRLDGDGPRGRRLRASDVRRRRHRAVHRLLRRPGHRPRPDGQPRATGAGRPADPRRRRAGRARRRPPRHGCSPDDRSRRADRRDRSRAADPGAGVRLGRRRRTADRHRARRPRCRLGRADDPGRDDGRQHVGAHRRHDGRSRRRHRLRAPAGDPPRGVPAPGPRRRRVRGAGDGHGRAVGRVRGHHGAGLTDGAAPGRALDVLDLRVRHRDRGGRGPGSVADAGPGVLPVRRPTAAATSGTPLPRARPRLR